MKQSDAHTVAQLYCTVFSEPPWNESWSIDDALKNVEDPLLQWWVIKEGAVTLGFVAGCFHEASVLHARFSLPPLQTFCGNVAYLSELGVHPDMRRQGLARSLSNHFVDFAHEQRAHFFCVRTRPNTGNFDWFDNKLPRIYTYEDGRVLFGSDHVIPL